MPPALIINFSQALCSMFCPIHHQLIIQAAFVSLVSFSIDKSIHTLLPQISDISLNCLSTNQAPLPSEAAPGTKIFISVPAASSEFPPLVAVKAESVVNGTVGGIKTKTSTALKVVEWKQNAKTCQLCDATFGWMRFRRHHHCRVCGASVCSACSPNVKCVPGYEKDQRVCNKCVKEELCEIIAPGVTATGAATPLM